MKAMKNMLRDNRGDQYVAYLILIVVGFVILAAIITYFSTKIDSDFPSGMQNRMDGILG